MRSCACECFSSKCQSFCFYKITGNTSVAIRMCTRQGKTPASEPPKILNCDENLPSITGNLKLLFKLCLRFCIIPKGERRSDRKLR